MIVSSIKKFVKRYYNKRVKGVANQVELLSKIPSGSSLYVLGSNNRIFIDNSIIRYGSIYTSAIPAHVVAAGIPAKTVKERVNYSRDLL